MNIRAKYQNLHLVEIIGEVSLTRCVAGRVLLPLESESFVVVSGMVNSTSWLDVGVVVDEVVGLAVLGVVLMLALVVGRVVAGRGVVVVVVVVVGVVVVVEVVVVLVVVGRGVVVVVVVD